MNTTNAASTDESTVVRGNKTYIANKHSNTPNCLDLNNWCYARQGRDSELRLKVFGNKKTSLSHYKSGMINISDDLWKRLKNAMEAIEKEEKGGALFSEEQSEPTEKSFKDIVNEWLSTNTIVKRRLANVAWAYNFTSFKDRSLANLTTSQFTNEVKNMNSDKAYDQSRIQAIMTKVSDLIAQNHPLAISAGISKSAKM